MITYSKASSKEELEQILALQRKNLAQNLNNEAKVTDGFVTIKHTLETLTKMNAICQHSIAKSKDKVVGYALSMTIDFANDIAILKPMFSEINKVFSNEKYLVMGQICIDKEHRKKGVFKELYAFMKTNVCLGRYSFIITEINILNKRSLKAHDSVGFIKLIDYKYGGRNWRIVSLKV